MKRFALLLLATSLVLFGCTQSGNGNPNAPATITVTVTVPPATPTPIVTEQVSPTLAPGQSGLPTPTAQPTTTGVGSIQRYCTNPSTAEGACSSTGKYCQPGQVRLICDCTQCPAPLGSGSSCESFCNNGQTSGTTGQTKTRWHRPEGISIDNGTYYKIDMPIEVTTTQGAFRLVSFGEFDHPKFLDGTGGMVRDLRVDLEVQSTTTNRFEVHAASATVVNASDGVFESVAFRSELADQQVLPNAKISGWVVFNPLPAEPKLTITLPGPVDAQGHSQQTVTFNADASDLVPA